MRVCFGLGGMLSCSDWHKIILLFPLRIACNFGSCAAHRTPPPSVVCNKKQQQQKTPRAQQCTSSPLIPCAGGKPNVKHHRTTPKPEVHITVEKAEAALASKKSTTINASGTAAAARVCLYTNEGDFNKPGIYVGCVGVCATA